MSPKTGKEADIFRPSRKQSLYHGPYIMICNGNLDRGRTFKGSICVVQLWRFARTVAHTQCTFTSIIKGTFSSRMQSGTRASGLASGGLCSSRVQSSYQMQLPRKAFPKLQAHIFHRIITATFRGHVDFNNDHVSLTIMYWRLSALFLIFDGHKATLPSRSLKTSPKSETKCCVNMVDWLLGFRFNFI